MLRFSLRMSLGLLVTGVLSGSAASAAEGPFGIRLVGHACATHDSAVCADGCGTDSDPVCDEYLSGCGEGCGSLLENHGGLCGLFRASDHCFDDFISPITNPVYFEDPRTLTEARFIYMHHRVPTALGGNEVQLFALQLRAALTEHLSIIATKDGFVTSDNPLINDGWADVAAGLKLNVYRDVCSQTLLSVGATYEAPVGTPRTLQGNGDGEFNLFLSGGSEFLDQWHYLTAGGWRLPVDQSAESTLVYWSNHIDRKLGQSGFYLLGETNWYHWTADGNAFPAPVEGLDLFNLGSRGVDNNDIVTGALGVKYKPSGNLELGFAWEVPLTDRRDIIDDRFTFDVIVRY